MKDKLAKLKEQFSKALELLKTENTEDALKEMEGAVNTVGEIEAAATTQEAEMEKMKKDGEDEKTEMTKIKEEMTKWADMYISAENVQKLLEDLKNGFKTDMTKMQEEFEKTIKELPKGSKQVVHKTGDEAEGGSAWDILNPPNNG